jgi:hypothetical protein
LHFLYFNKIYFFKTGEKIKQQNESRVFTFKVKKDQPQFNDQSPTKTPLAMTHINKIDKYLIKKKKSQDKSLIDQQEKPFLKVELKKANPINIQDAIKNDTCELNEFSVLDFNVNPENYQRTIAQLPGKNSESLDSSTKSIMPQSKINQNQNYEPILKGIYDFSFKGTFKFKYI